MPSEFQQSSRNVFLIGPMGAGKTTIGRQLARKLQNEFIDSDREVEAAAGVGIPTIFDYEGEEGFRAREARILDVCTQKQGVVLATGGGAIMREDNRQHLQTRGTVVYLHTTVAEQLNRTRRDRDRPLLQTPDRQQRLTSLMAAREPLYRALAHITLCTDGRHPRNVVDQLLRALKSAAPQQ